MILLHLLQAAAAAVQETAQSVATAAHAANVTPTDNAFATGGIAIVVAFAMQAVKNSNKFPWVSRSTSRLNFWLGILTAVASTAGVHITYDATIGGTIALPGLHALLQSVIQWSTQQGAYKGLVVMPETLGEIRSMMERILTPPPVSEGAEKAKEGQ